MRKSHPGGAPLPLLGQSATHEWEAHLQCPPNARIPAPRCHNPKTRLCSGRPGYLAGAPLMTDRLKSVAAFLQRTVLAPLVGLCNGLGALPAGVAGAPRQLRRRLVVLPLATLSYGAYRHPPF